MLQLLGKLLLLLQQTFATILEGTCGLCFLLQLLYLLLQLMYPGCCLQSCLSGETCTDNISNKPAKAANSTSDDRSSLECMRRK